ncbi:MAG: type II secretion system protein N [Hellea sp.]
MAQATPHKTMTWAVRLLGAGLVAALGFVIFKAVITLTAPESVWKSPAAGPVSAQSPARGGAQSFTFTTDPFNRAVAPEIEVIAEVGEDAPETTLNLKLTGRTAGPNGTAILRTPDGKEGNYRLEDEIVPGVTLQAVNKAFIVLNVDGQIQRLTFERGEETGLMVKTADAEPSKTSVAVKVPGRKVAPQGKNSGEPTAISADVSTLFQNISLRRVMKDGQLKGYSVKANRPGVDLKPFGFAKGDIVTQIGGTDITRGRPDFLALFEKAAQSGGTEVTVLRNGQIRTIKLGTP